MAVGFLGAFADFAAAGFGGWPAEVAGELVGGDPVAADLGEPVEDLVEFALGDFRGAPAVARAGGWEFELLGGHGQSSARAMAIQQCGVFMP